MKKIIHIILILVLTVSVLLLYIGCKDEAVFEEPVAEELTVEEPVAEKPEEVEKQKTQNTTTLATVLRSNYDPYHLDVIRGTQLFAKSINSEHLNVLLAYEGSSEKQMNDIKAWIAKTEGNIVFQIDPNQTSDLIALAKVLDEAGVYWSSIWDKPKGVRVSDYDYWAASINFDCVTGAYEAAKALFDAIGGKGDVFALQGQLGHSATTTRWKGFEKALEEYPEINLVGWQDGNWEKDKAYTLTSNALVAHPNIKAIWCANDSMATGVMEALRGRGLLGEIKISGFNAVPEMIQAISKGEATATVSTDPYWQGGMALSIPLAAKEGRLDISELGEDYRAWLASHILITEDNVEDYIKNYLETPPEYDWDDFFGHRVGPDPGL